MALRKQTQAQPFALPAELDPVPNPEAAQPMLWYVKPMGVGLRRRLEAMLLNHNVREQFAGGAITDSTVMALLAYLTYGGTTFTYEDTDEPVLPEEPDLKEFLMFWDSLPEAIANWIMERVWEVNPHMRPSQLGFDGTE